ncbi:MAG: Maf family protein [Halobacteriovoraceae bacterium]|nr:Maf family protein [Halobacteriovoraceae bacterium]
MKKILLASTSPYRAALLERLCLSFDTQNSNVDEDSFKAQISDPKKLTETLAKEKARSVLEKNPSALVIGGDQVSLFNNEVLGKPGTPENAVEQLLKLQGNTHELVTSTCILLEDIEVLWTEITSLTMRPLTEKECLSYVKKDNPIQCAGSYKMECLGISLFEKIKGEDQSSIVGLPLIRLTTELRKLGYSVP